MAKTTATAAVKKSTANKSKSKTKSVVKIKLKKRKLPRGRFTPFSVDIDPSVLMPGDVLDPHQSLDVDGEYDAPDTQINAVYLDPMPGSAGMRIDAKFDFGGGSWTATFDDVGPAGCTYAFKVEADYSREAICPIIVKRAPPGP
jgi:hypothetical protein